MRAVERQRSEASKKERNEGGRHLRMTPLAPVLDARIDSSPETKCMMSETQCGDLLACTH